MRSGPVWVGGTHAVKVGPALQQCTGQTRASGEEKQSRLTEGEEKQSRLTQAPCPWGPRTSPAARYIGGSSRCPCSDARLFTLHNLEQFLCFSFLQQPRRNKQGSSDSSHMQKLSAEVKEHLPGTWLEQRQVQINHTADTYGRSVWGVSFGHTIRFYHL